MLTRLLITRSFARRAAVPAIRSVASFSSLKRFEGEVDLLFHQEHQRLPFKKEFDIAPKAINPGAILEEEIGIDLKSKDIDHDLSSIAGFKDARVSRILERKQGQPIITITEDSTVFAALQAMETNRIGAILVMNCEGQIVGIFSERDYINKLAVNGLKSHKTILKDVMTTDVTCVSPDITASECMELITNNRFRHLPVIDDKRSLLGIISIGDIVQFLSEQQKQTIKELHHYIKSSE